MCIYFKDAGENYYKIRIKLYFEASKLNAHSNQYFTQMTI